MCVLTAALSLVVSEWTVYLEIAQFVKWDPGPLVAMVLTLQGDVGTG